MQNLLRQNDEHHHHYKATFSAYARELAFLLLNGYESVGSSPNLHMWYLVRWPEPTKSFTEIIKKNESILSAIVKGNAEGLIGINEALMAFAALGLPINKKDYEQSSQYVVKSSNLDEKKKQSIKDYVKIKGPTKDDPTQWSVDYLRDVVEFMLKQCEMKYKYMNKGELGTYRTMFSEWFPKGNGIRN